MNGQEEKGKKKTHLKKQKFFKDLRLLQTVETVHHVVPTPSNNISKKEIINEKERYLKRVVTSRREVELGIGQMTG